MNVTDGIICGTIEELSELTSELETKINLMRESYEIKIEDELEDIYYLELYEREEDALHYTFERARELLQDEYECDSYTEGFTESKDVGITTIR